LTEESVDSYEKKNIFLKKISWINRFLFPFSHHGWPTKKSGTLFLKRVEI
jgi:hypothetical protein